MGGEKGCNARQFGQFIPSRKIAPISRLEIKWTPELDFLSANKHRVQLLLRIKITE